MDRIMHVIRLAAMAVIFTAVTLQPAAAHSAATPQPCTCLEALAALSDARCEDQGDCVLGLTSCVWWEGTGRLEYSFMCETPPPGQGCHAQLPTECT